MDKKVVDNFKNRINEIETPKEADEIIKRAMERGDRKKGIKYFKPLTAAAVLMICIICAVNSPALATYLERMPVIKNIFGFENKGVENAINNGFIQKPNTNLPSCGQEASCNGITITIDGLMMSGNKLNLAYTLKADESQKELKDLRITKLQILDNKGSLLWQEREIVKAADNKVDYVTTKFNSASYGTYDNESFVNSRSVRGFYELTTEESKADIPESITLKVTGVGEDWLNQANNKQSEFYKKFKRLPQAISGEWIINIKLDKKFLEADGVIYKPVEEIKDDMFKFEYVNVYPTVANAKFTLYNGYDINGLGKSVYLENEKGEKYMAKESGSSSDDKKIEYKFNFESPYFDKPEKLYLVINNIDGGTFKKNKTYRIELIKTK